MGLFKRKPTKEERKMLDIAVQTIQRKAADLRRHEEEAYKYFHASDDREKAMVRIKLNGMYEVTSDRVTAIATKWNPISWIGFGLCNPFSPSRPIMIAEKVFKEGQDSVTEILAHEWSHSRLRTIDGKLAQGIVSERFDDLIKDAWAWSNLFIQ